MKRLWAAFAAIGILSLGACASDVQMDKTADAPKFKEYTNVIDFDAMKALAVIPTREDVMIIDARPKKRRFDVGHIPGAVSIPDTFFAKMTDKLPADKGTRLVYYCGGFKCALSHKSAYKAEALGYTNIAVYAGGEPEWKAKGELLSMSATHLKKLMDKKESKVVVIDSRPTRGRYKKGHIPGAINIPDTFFAKMTDKLPTDKSTPLVFYCQGPKCPLSTKSAIKAKALGYTNVMVFQGGYPEWVAAFGEGAKG
ncbi:MAG: rhodanese-like domain-containing protein [Magnetospiraceae bacterium]